MKEIILFQGVRDESGDLSVRIENSAVSSFMDKEFWQKIVEDFDKSDLTMFDVEDRTQVEKIIGIIKKGLEEWEEMEREEEREEAEEEEDEEE